MRGDLASSPAASQAPSRGEAVARVVACLVDSGVEPEQARDDARLLLRAAAGLTRLELAMAPDALLTEEQALRLSAFAARRAAREPVSRILGARGFWTLDLAVMPNVLDPRADTETLVETTLALVGDRNAPLSIVDLGSGSGAILCALLSELPLARGLAVDLSPDACAATRENLRRCGLSGRAQVVRGRWGASLKGPFDVVVSNPPYVRAGDLVALDPEVSLHDPALALDGGADGLVCYRDIIADLGRLLAPGGLAAFEVGFDQAASVAALLGAHGFIVERIARDAAGRDRVVAARPVRPRS
ncbi:peptide chain release factor N(5)-glutamine methyltransferase [Methylocystis sp. IM3]|uniref:peptide chain release factor N(5)-glutamine methyltransferase n=1 Tax=unclassified Methylocystis TaxID=2625913 RepID=UPI0030F88F0D